MLGMGSTRTSTAARSPSRSSIPSTFCSVLREAPVTVSSAVPAPRWPRPRRTRLAKKNCRLELRLKASRLARRPQPKPSAAPATMWKRVTGTNTQVSVK